MDRRPASELTIEKRKSSGIVAATSAAETEATEGAIKWPVEFLTLA